MLPGWLVVVAWVFIAAAIASALTVLVDLFVLGRRQAMWIMDVVWPVTSLWAGPFALYAYVHWGRAGEQHRAERAKRRGDDPPSRRQPFPVLAAKGTTHCGSGCTLGDIAAELLTLVIPFTVFGHRLFGAWVYDFVLAYLMGIAFQYFTIKPMGELSIGAGLAAALKADTLSLIAWQLGMYGWMAIATFAIFGRELPKGSPVFWFMMQIAMFFGFATSYPVNWWLLRRGIKEMM